VIGILRAIGWYALLPLLLISLMAIWKTPPKNERTAWFWLWMMAWIWIILSSIRAGGDQWDNPRYRAIFLLWQAALASQAWTWWRASKNPWPVRILAVELLSLAFFTEWYASRYITSIGLKIMPFGVMIATIVIINGLILVGGWIWDCWRASRRP
jgi:hypothetical protein